jgi:hypothetical protein
MSTEQIIVNDVAIQTCVAPIEVTPVEVAVKQTKEKKPKKVSDSPKLAPKFQKYLYFGYWVALQLKNKNLINDDVFQTILTDIKMNDELGVQTEFYTNYENVEFKMVSRKPTVSPDAPSLTADGLEVKPKAKKSRKPTGRDSTPDAPSLTADGLEVKPKAKKSRKPKVVATEAVPVEGLVEGLPVEKPKAAKKARKPKVVASDATEAGVVEGVADAVPVEKPKAAKKARKPKVVASDATTSDATDTLPVEAAPVEGGPVEGGPVEDKPKTKKARKVVKPTVSPTTPSLPEEGAVEGGPVEEKSTKKARKPKATKSLSNADDIIHELLSSVVSSE